MTNQALFLFKSEYGGTLLLPLLLRLSTLFFRERKSLSKRIKAKFFFVKFGLTIDEPKKWDYKRHGYQKGADTFLKRLHSSTEQGVWLVTGWWKLVSGHIWQYIIDCMYLATILSWDSWPHEKAKQTLQCTSKMLPNAGLTTSWWKFAASRPP